MKDIGLSKAMNIYQPMRLVMLIMCLAGCQQTGDFRNQVLDEAGVFPIGKDGRIEVKVNDKNILEYYLYESGRLTIDSRTIDRHPSVFHKWALLLDETDNLWFYSGDIGSGVWKKVANKYAFVSLYYDDEVAMKTVPRPIFKFLKNRIPKK